MMHMVKPNTCCKPLKDFRQPEKGTPLHRLLSMIPFPVAYPGYILELVLNIKKPHAPDRGEDNNRHLDEQVGRESDGEILHAEPKDGEGEVGQVGTHPLAGRTTLSGETVENHEKKRSPDEHHDQGVAVKPVPEPSQS